MFILFRHSMKFHFFISLSSNYRLNVCVVTKIIYRYELDLAGFVSTFCTKCLQSVAISIRGERIFRSHVPKPRNAKPGLVIVSSPDDCDDKNLSWLYNFKLNELPHLSPDINRGRTETGLQVDKLIEEATSNLDDSPQQPVEPTPPENIPKS